MTLPPFRFSPSAQSAFRDCPRKWWFDKVAKIPRPSDEAQAWGTAVHYVLENYLRDGTRVAPGTYHDGRDTIVVDQDHITRAERSHKDLPAPGTWKVELWVPSLEIIPGLKVAAKIDAYNVAARFILDHKSTKTIRVDGPYATTPATLAKNDQGLFYAGALVRTDVLEPGDVNFAHNQIQRVGAVCTRRINTVLPAKRIDAAWERSIGTAEEMVEVWKKAPGGLAEQDAVPYRLEACGDYGGCQMASICTAYQASRRGNAPTLLSLASGLDAARTPGAPMAPPIAKAPSPFGRPKAPSPAAAPAAPAPTTAVVSANAVPVDPETVRGALLRDLCTELALVREDSGGLALTYSDVEETARANMVPPQYWPNVAVAMGIEVPYPTPTPPADHPNLLGGWPHTAAALVNGPTVEEGAVADAAAGLLTLSGAALAEAVSEAPVEVLEAARATVEDPAAGAVLDAALTPDAPSEDAEAILAKYTDDPKRTAAAVAIYRALVDGTLTMATQADVHEALRTAGYTRVRNPAPEVVLAALGRVPTLTLEGGVVALAAGPAKAPEAPAAKPPAPATPPDKAPAAEAVLPAHTPPPGAVAVVEAAPGALRAVNMRTECTQELLAALDIGYEGQTWEQALTEAELLAQRADAAAARTDPPAPAPFTLVIGPPPRGVPSVHFRTLPVVVEAVRIGDEKIQAKVEGGGAAGADAHPALYSFYGQTAEKHYTAELDRLLANGHTLPAGTWAWMGRGDNWADERAGLFRVLADAGAIVAGA